MYKRHPDLPFFLGAPSMVFGNDLIENVETLANIVDDVEIVLFHTPTMNNIPKRGERGRLRRLGERERVSFTVHLPTSLEPAGRDADRRKASCQLARQLCLKMAELEPKHFVLHLSITEPTLVMEPEQYLHGEHGFSLPEWTGYAMDFLNELGEVVRKPGQLLVENINYPPRFLEPFVLQGACQLCLDLGHLQLGRENVVFQLQQYKNATRVIHLHGVRGYREHLSLKKMEKGQIRGWLDAIYASSFDGILTLEVFTPRDLQESIQVVLETFGSDRGRV